jgi:imidazoleglycerol phosphate synthase glutamine amidotransferase subunit HisH
VHAFYPDPHDPAAVVGTTEVDGFRFPSLIRAGSVTATQFHPEKSGPFGRALLAAFVTGRLDAAVPAASGRAPAWS